jgi:hypothetical protein
MFEASDNSVIGRYARAYRPSKGMSITFRVLQFLLAAAFLSAGAAALAGAHVPVETFEKIGLGQWLRYYTGGLEVVFASLLMIPRTAALAAAVPAAIMLGAVAADLLVVGGSQAPAAVLLLPAAALAWYRSRYE